MLVEASIYDEAVEKAIAKAEQTTVGPASAEGRHIGPVVSEVHWTKIQGLIQDGIDEGARVVAGGPGKPDGGNAGYLRPHQLRPNQRFRPRQAHGARFAVGHGRGQRDFPRHRNAVRRV